MYLCMCISISILWHVCLIYNINYFNDQICIFLLFVLKISPKEALHKVTELHPEILPKFVIEVYSDELAAIVYEALADLLIKLRHRNQAWSKNQDEHLKSRPRTVYVKALEGLFAYTFVFYSDILIVNVMWPKYGMYTGWVSGAATGPVHLARYRYCCKNTPVQYQLLVSGQKCCHLWPSTGAMSLCCLG